MLRIYNIPVALDKKDESLKSIVSNYLKISTKSIKSAILFKSSIDARKKDNIHFIYCIDVELSNEDNILKLVDKKVEKISPYTYTIQKCKFLDKRPLVVGFGPAGMFAALILAQAGQYPIVIERGCDIDARTKDVYEFWNNRNLKIDSNVQFGEGGAGTFSDGKLNTGIKDLRCRKVLEEFVSCGAPKESLYVAKPHIGTDKLKATVKNLRNKIISLGGEVKFGTKLVEILHSKGTIQGAVVESNGNKYEIITNNIILSIGHSARDTFKMIHNIGVDLKQKPFSVGVRIEHLQSMINDSQYGKFAKHPALGLANYKLAIHLKNGRGVYTFCMCPGGSVVSASSESGMVVTNGMSEFARDKINANSAVLVGLNPGDFEDDNPLTGVEFQRRIERNAFILGGENYNAPVQRLEDFLNDKVTNNLGDVCPSYKPGYKFANLSLLFPEYITSSLRMGIVEMDRYLKGFADRDTILTGPETRSSSPIRITRDVSKQSISLKGLYPCGEGAGYAGGIISAAVDGISCAESIIYK